MIVASRDGDIVTLRIDRPSKANALTAAMLHELADHVSDLGDCKALILTSAGHVFSAGADLDEARAGLATDPVWERLSGGIASAPCLTVATLPGTVAGGAMGMVLACDLRVAAPGTRFFYPVMRLGYLPQPSDPARLLRLAGPSAARRILLGGEKLTAREALACGLIDDIVARDDLTARAHALCADARGATPQHIAAIKQMLTVT